MKGHIGHVRNENDVSQLLDLLIVVHRKMNLRGRRLRQSCHKITDSRDIAMLDVVSGRKESRKQSNGAKLNKDVLTLLQVLIPVSIFFRRPVRRIGMASEI